MLRLLIVVVDINALQPDKEGRESAYHYVAEIKIVVQVRRAMLHGHVKTL